LSLFDTPEGKKELSQTLISALKDKGFFYVKNFGISQERVDEQFAIGKAFYDLPLEEKQKYTVQGLGILPPLPRQICVLMTCRAGSVQRLRSCWSKNVISPLSLLPYRFLTIDSLNKEAGIRSQVEVYNIPSSFLSFLPPSASSDILGVLEFNGDFSHNHPGVIQERLPEIQEFAKVFCPACVRSSVSLTAYLQDLHSKVLDPLFVLLAIVLELPEDRFTRIHQYPVKSEV
jgi:isopenicillin N synthase-like dioxygenase